jgi:iron complex outermembrane receptor protein
MRAKTWRKRNVCFVVYLTEKLSLVTGVQAAYVQRHFYDTFTNSAPSDLDQSGKLDFRTLNPKIGLIYELTDKDQLYANFSRSWQPPSFDDIVDRIVQHQIRGQQNTRSSKL